MEEQVTIVDRDILKVISVDTRMDILKILSEGERNPSFISKQLHKSDSTIIEHLETLRKAGLVKKVETPGKKWVFYTLTERGQGIISSKNRRLVIILGISLLSLAGGIANLFSQNQFASQSFAERIVAPTASGAGNVTTNATSAVSAFPWVSIALFIVFFLGVAYYLKKRYF